jgi:hypothetical protein
MRFPKLVPAFLLSLTMMACASQGSDGVPQSDEAAMTAGKAPAQTTASCAMRGEYAGLEIVPATADAPARLKARFEGRTGPVCEPNYSDWFVTVEAAIARVTRTANGAVIELSNAAAQLEKHTTANPQGDTCEGEISTEKRSIPLRSITLTAEVGGPDDGNGSVFASAVNADDDYLVSAGCYIPDNVTGLQRFVESLPK